VTTTWNDTPPATPPTTDTDPCVAWGAEADHAHHGHVHHDVPPYQQHEAPAWSLPQWDSTGLPTPPPEARPTITRKGRGAKVLAGTVAVAALLGAGFVAGGLVDDASNTATGPTPTTASAMPVADPTPLVEDDAEEPVAAVAEALGPSVVKIQTQDGLGSGVVYDESGLILTNAHVIAGSTAVQVVFSDGTTADGEVLGSDAANDIAVVQVSVEELAVARLADEPARVGQLAVAVGSPFGLEQTVTSGVVSAVNRPVQGGDDGSGAVVGMLQTDAPINPGNSGGALANRQGEVIGINSMIFSQSGENNGIGFAIPIDRAKEIADALVNGGSVGRGILGVRSTTPTTGEAGAEIAEVTRGSAAAAAGLEVGDVIVAVDGTSIKAQGDLAVAIGSHQPGDQVDVEIVRDGSSMTVQVTLGSE
jgi:putative serine protease PepD